MSIHIEAASGDISDIVLLPGDPLRARFVAETYLTGAKQYNNVRGMLGYTGSWKGRRVSVQGTGMGLPSISIYVHELLAEYGARTLIRIGTCGAFDPSYQVGDIILAQAAATDSAMNKLRFDGCDYPPVASFELLLRARDAAQRMHMPARIGTVFSSDVFYRDDPGFMKRWIEYGVAAVEMETSALYTEGAHYRAEVLSILSVSDNIATGAVAPAQQRERGFGRMVELALEAAAGEGAGKA